MRQTQSDPERCLQTGQSHPSPLRSQWERLQGQTLMNERGIWSSVARQGKLKEPSCQVFSGLELS